MTRDRPQRHAMPSAARVAAELARLNEELEEIAMLVGQAREETERHEGRRAKGEERVRALEKDAAAGPR